MSPLPCGQSEATVAVRRSGDRPDALEVAGRRRGEAGLDHVDAEPLELRGDLGLLVWRSAMPGDCSPSRSVVSKIVILRTDTSRLLLTWRHPGSETH